MSDKKIEDSVEEVLVDDAPLEEGKVEAEVVGDPAEAVVESTVKESAPPKTKAGMISAMLDAMKDKKKDDLTASYSAVMAGLKVEGFEAEEISEEKYLNQKGTGESDDGYADAGLFDKSEADKLAKKHKGKAVKDAGGKFLVQLKEATTQSIKEIRQISSEDISIAEDVEAMFGSEELSEDFVVKATTIFEAAVVSKVNQILESVTVDFEAELEAEKVQIVEELSTQVDSYLEYVAEEWMKENELAVEQGIRSEIVENFMSGLRSLFTENYIDIPEEKVDLVDELASKVEELESSINEEMERNIELRKELVESKRESILSAACGDITESQAVKLSSLSEGVEFEDEAAFTSKLDTLKENYFPKEETISEEAIIDDEPLELIEEATPTDPGMAAYLNAISKSIKK